MARKFPRLTQRLPGATCLALTTMLLGLPSPVYAALCEWGPIRLFELEKGGSSVLHIGAGPVNDNSASDTKYRAANGSMVTRIWYDNDTRWKDRLAWIRTGLALNVYTELYSSDSNCMGPSDEFTFMACSPSGCPRS